jgi:hypothetical protein
MADYRSWYGNVDRPGVAVWSEHVGNEDLRRISGGYVSNRRIVNDKRKGTAEPGRPVSARGAIDPEGEWSCAIPVESPGGCDQRWNVSTNNNVTEYNASAIEFEDLAVCRACLRVLIPGSQSHCEIDVCPDLGHIHSAKRRGPAAAGAVVASEVKGYGLSRRRRQQTGDEQGRGAGEDRKGFGFQHVPLSFF